METFPHLAWATTPNLKGMSEGHMEVVSGKEILRESQLREIQITDKCGE
jgi:hypothetical protein